MQKFNIPDDFMGVEPFKDRITDMCSYNNAYQSYRKNRTEIILDKKAYIKKRAGYHK